MISDEAVDALAHVLAHEALVEADIAGSGWDAENDSPEHFIPRARERARAYLEAAAPFIAAEAWHRGYVSALDNMEFNDATTNPYRSQA